MASYYIYIVFFMVLNSNLPFLTPETSVFSCFGVDTTSTLAQEWLGSKGGLVKKSKTSFPKFWIVESNFCPKFISSIVYHVFRLLVEGTTHARLVDLHVKRNVRFCLTLSYIYKQVVLQNTRKSYKVLQCPTFLLLKNSRHHDLSSVYNSSFYC